MITTVKHKSFYLVGLLTVCAIKALVAQCPNQIWDTSNQGMSYVDDIGNKAVFGSFTNTNKGQYVNDGHLYFFGDITNNGYVGDGHGHEFIKSCDGSTTLISGAGFTEFNVIDIDNTGDVILEKDIRIMDNLIFSNGIVHTDRNVFRERVFFIDGASYTGATDEKHVDGAVSRQGEGPFIYPLGDGDHLGRLSASGNNSFDIFLAAYYSTLLPEDQYNAKGPFPVELTDLDVSAVQPKEFWTLTGGQSTAVTLFWSEFSEIDNLVDDINDLVIVGWDSEKWVNLGNTAVMEIGSAGTVTSQSVMPDRYEAFTFGVVDSDSDGYIDSKDVAPFDPCIPDDTSPACMSNTCIDVRLSVFLEGPLQSGRIGEYNDEMRTRLNRFGYLPGQRPTTLLGTATTAGQPYNREPWNYGGTEGLEYNAFAQGGSEIYQPDVVDWVYVSIRTNQDHISTVCRKSGLLMIDGTVEMTESFDCCDLSEEEYYVVIEHRNHLPVMTPRPVAIDESGTITFDFRANQSFTRLFGNGQKEVNPGVYAMYAGNGDQTLAGASIKDINANDLSLWTGENGDHSGYYFQDYDLNGDVNVHDKAIWLTNNGVFTDVDR